MKNKKWIKIIILCLAILACISIPIILYFTIGQKDTGKVNLSNQNISYLAEVKHMNNITEQEANTIKTGIQNNIDSTLKSLGLTTNEDYTISGLEKLQATANLDDIIISINSVPNSEKAIGSTNVNLNVREDISDRSINPIDVPVAEEEGLEELTVSNILRNIKIEVDDIFSEGQANEEDRDYEIVNKNLIVVGAKFSDYSQALKVRALTSSTHLKGEFAITFVLK